MEDWKDLEIGNIPSDFFVNERYGVECFQNGTDRWRESIYNDTPQSRVQIIIEMQACNAKYRYRLKPLEPIRITKEIAGLLKSPSIKDLKTWKNRPVEIID